VNVLEIVNLLYNYAFPVPPFFINTILANVGNLTNRSQTCIDSPGCQRESFRGLQTARCLYQEKNKRLKAWQTYRIIKVNTDKIQAVMQ